MKSKLQVKTQCQEAEEDRGDTPVSPSGQYFNSKTLSVCVIAVLEFGIPIDDSCAMDLIQNLFLPISPRFSSIMVHDRKGVKHWKRVEVKLQEHINIPKYPDGLSIEEYDDYFDKYLTKIAMDPLPQHRPLWTIHITKYPTSKAAGNLIFKLHHALGDGFSLMGALLSCLQRVDDPSLPLNFPSLQPTSTASTNKMDAIGCVPRILSPICNTALDFGWSVLKSSWLTDDKTPIRSGDGAVELRPVKISTIALSLDHISKIKRKLGVTVNDVITGVVFLGTRLYMQQTGKGFGHSESTALVLLNTRNINGYKSVQEMLQSDEITKWGNQFAFLHVGLPELDNEQSLSPLDFVAQAHKIITRKKNSLAVYLTGQGLETIRKLRGPEAAAQFIHSTLANSSMTVSNVIGPVEEVALANHPMKGLYFMVVGVPQSLTFTIMSYMRTLRIAIGVEKDHIDSQKFNSCIENAFELIYKAAHESA